MSGKRLIRSGHSAAFLPESSPLRRQPRKPHRRRPPEFLARFEGRALAYDCFFAAGGRDVLLVGPPPMNLMTALRSARYTALPSRTVLRPQFFPSLSTMITRLADVPAGTSAVRLALGGEAFELPVQPSHVEDLAGRRVMFTMSKDNDLAWIAEWARWHQRLHGTDAIVFFDNGSSRYGAGEIEETLLGIGGIERVAVQSWPYSYGMTDPALSLNPFYILFLQVSSMSVALRRYAAAGSGLLNCDIDELAASPPGTTVFDLCRSSRHGLVVMRGRYMEPEGDDDVPVAHRTHRHFTRHYVDPRRSLSRPNKWVLDPTRAWVQKLSVQPYMHWIEGRPWFSKARPAGVFYRHFRGINTNWKDRRTAPRHDSDDELVCDAAFADLVARHAF